MLRPINSDMALIENHAYLRLLLVFKGDKKPSEALAEASGANDVPTLAYGLGAFSLLNGDRQEAQRLFELATSGPSWPAFGFLAAEATLAGLSSGAG
jgi:hypothetical protein